MSKQTAVDFMHDAFMEVLSRKRPMTSNEVVGIWIEAKEMEKEQICQAYSDGLGNGQHYERDELSGSVLDEHKYYNETYKGGNS